MANDLIEVRGLDDFEDALVAAGAKTGFKFLRRVLAKGGQIVAKAGKDRVRVKTGALRQAIGVSTQKGRRGTAAAVALIGPKTRNKRALALAQSTGRKIKGIFYGHIVERDYPFMRPALDENVNAVVDAIAKDVARAMDELGRR